MIFERSLTLYLSKVGEDNKLLLLVGQDLQSSLMNLTQKKISIKVTTKQAFEAKVKLKMGAKESLLLIRVLKRLLIIFYSRNL